MTLDYLFAQIEFPDCHIFQMKNQQNDHLPIEVLNSYPMLLGCSVHYNFTTPKTHVCAYRREDKSIACATFAECKDYLPDSLQIIRKNKRNGYWIDSEVNGQKVKSYCEPILNEQKKTCGILKLDFSLKEITHVICNYKLFTSGYLFITDQQGNFIAHPNPAIVNSNVYDLINSLASNKIQIVNSFIRGETGCGDILKNEVRYYFYFTQIPKMNWRLGLVCPYDEIMMTSNKLYILLFLCFSFGIVFLFASIIKIVRSLSSPLKELTNTARKMAEGDFDTKLISPNSSMEIRELYESFNYMQKNITNYIERLKISMTEKEQLNSEMRLAQKIQQRFLPTQIQLPPNIELFAKLKQSKEVGGDLYEYFIIDNKLYFAIGDVSGYGTPAALYMASVIKLFRYVASSNNSTAEICNIINTHMCNNMDNNMDDDMYITMFMGIMDLSAGIITFTNAGHPYPLIVYANNEIDFLNKYPDVPIGVLEEHTYEEHIYTLEPDSYLVLYTDGITDAENIEGVFYGKEKMVECIKHILVKNPKNIVNAILNDIDNHIKNTKQSDDLTMLSIAYKDI